MTVSVICVGKLKEKYWVDACAEYSKRLSRFCDLKINELPESKSDNVKEESDSILKALPKSAYVIALDVKGRSLSSEDLASKFTEIGLGGQSHICFIIGGSNGYDDRVRAAADFRLSFSSFTFPHQLMRTVLLEQVYRAFKINAGEKYHK